MIALIFEVALVKFFKIIRYLGQNFVFSNTKGFLMINQIAFINKREFEINGVLT